MHIIPYQELLGNYDDYTQYIKPELIIPYQELLGNYDVFDAITKDKPIIPYQELLGNYDWFWLFSDMGRDYTIPRAIRELWLPVSKGGTTTDYTIPRAIRELWP